ncbi:MAG: Lrp/AsnC family transcriptional regulator [Promethearchaeota archaeon]|nr:MAG: Lrp/AsnC family transcriptional regulator [Candidatus Lokiarchaeota archaeon]
MSKVKVDEVDMKILQILGEDSKTNYREIGKNLDIAIGTVSNRINNLKERGLIKKFTIDVDMFSIGYEITAIILIQIEGKFIHELEEQLAKEPNVYAIYDTTGDWDSIILVKFKHVHDLNAFLKRLNKMEHVKQTSTSVCLNVIKESICFPLQEVLNKEE